MGKYIVKVDDNFHYMDESERYDGGSYSTLEEAIRRCEEIAIRSLEDLYEKGIDSGKLMTQWMMFGEDPFVTGAENVPFSARDYIDEPLCQKIVSKKIDIGAMLFAVSAHRDQKYGEYPYAVHLGFVNHYVNRYKHLLSGQTEMDIAVASGWLHDTIEDCPDVSYEKLKEDFGEQIADTVQALTNVGGEYNLAGLKNNKVAFFVKLCDRLANVYFSRIDFKEKAYNKYVHQFEEIFKNCPEEFKQMAEEIKSLLGEVAA